MSGVSKWRRSPREPPEFDRLIAERKPDLVLVDGDHSLAAVRRDLAAVIDHAQAVATHDITDNCSPGVRQTWQAFRHESADGWDFQEFTGQYDEVTERLGGTLSVSGSRSARRSPRSLMSRLSARIGSGNSSIGDLAA